MKTKLTILLFLASLTILYGQSKVNYIQSENFAKQGLPFSLAVQVDNILYLSGQIGGNATGLVPGGIIPETKQIMENIKAVLEQNGSSMDKVIKCTCMLADMNEWAAMNSEYIKYFPNHKPARSAFGTSGLARGARAEIECMAYVK
jgi:2-iminobutanoate/2-iminopropanoate deaminase